MNRYAVPIAVPEENVILTEESVSSLAGLPVDPESQKWTREYWGFWLKVARGDRLGTKTVEELLTTYPELQDDLLDVMRVRRAMKTVEKQRELDDWESLQGRPRPDIIWGRSPSGSLVDLGDLEREAARERSAAASRAAKLEASRVEREAEARARAEHQAAVEASIEAQMPAHLRGRS